MKCYWGKHPTYLPYFSANERKHANVRSYQDLLFFDNDYLHDGHFFMLLVASADFFKVNFFKKFFQEHYQSVKQFESGSGPTLALVQKLFAKLSADVKSRRWQEKSLNLSFRYRDSKHIHVEVNDATEYFKALHFKEIIQLAIWTSPRGNLIFAVC